MTNVVPNIVGPISGLVGIGIMAGAANTVIKQIKPKKDKSKNRIKNYKLKSFSDTMDKRIKNMLWGELKW